MKGRKRLPDNFKVIKGTAQPCRMNPDAPTAPEDMPRPPMWLSSRSAVEHFGALRSRIEALGIASSVDTEMLAMAAERLAEIEECNKFIEEYGALITVRDDEGNPKSVRNNPAIGRRNDAMRHLQGLLAEFGLSPASRSRASVPKKGGAQSVFAKLNG